MRPADAAAPIRPARKTPARAPGIPYLRYRMQNRGLRRGSLGKGKQPPGPASAQEAGSAGVFSNASKRSSWAM